MFPFGVAFSYREEVVMKKLFIACISLCSILFFACNFGIKKDFATVEIYFGDPSSFARAVDPVTSLPELSSAYIKIEVEGNLSGYSVKELKPADLKNISLNLPVGDTVRIKVSVSNPSGIWSGSVTHTVDPDNNVVGIKLKKNVSGLNNLLFTQTEDGQHGYNLTPYMGGKKITVHPSHRQYSFARDSKGRLYVGYEEHGTPTLTRYTSEGNNPETINLSTPAIAPNLLMNDFTKGVSYVVGFSGNVYKIEENSVSTTSLATLAFCHDAAAIDDNRVVWAWKDNPSDPLKLYVKNNLESSGENPIRIDIAEHIGMHDCVPYRIPDIFIRGGYVYVLFTALKDSSAGDTNNLYSLGGVVRYNINNLAENPVKIGFDDDPDFDDGVLEDYDYSENFYGAVKVIGFDDENIYIADDGFDAAYIPQAEGPRIVKNRNRIAALNIATNTVSFTEEYTAKWYNEWKEWRTPNTKILLWEKGTDGSYPPPSSPTYGMQYWISDTAGTASPTNVNDESVLWFSTEQQDSPTDIFCYDQDGNLYIVYNSVSDSKVRRFPVKTDGSYDKTAFQDLTIGSVGSVAAIAVDISDGKNYLYYNTGTGNTIKRHEWGQAGQEGFDMATQDTAYSITLSGATPTTQVIVTALAANKDGVFVGVKEIYEQLRIKKYRLKVRKYEKAHGTQGNEIVLVDNAAQYTNEAGVAIDHEPATSSHLPYIEYTEAINGLQVIDGVLYAITSKTEQKHVYEILFPGYGIDEFKSSGILYKIAKTASFSGNAEKIAVKNPISADGTNPGVGYGFYRFIAVKPKKVVIASDGAWGKNGNSPSHVETSNNKVFVYDLDKNSLEETDAHATFSKELSPGSGFEWK